MRLHELFTAIRYAPHVRQLEFHDNDVRFKLLIAGARFGKSLASARDVLIDLLSGPTRGWLVGPTYALARPEFRYIRDDILSRMHGTVSSSNNPPTLHSSWGGEVICMSAHMPETLLGEEVDWMVLCEAAHISREAFERFLRARLVSRNGRLLVPTTPRGHNWIHELYEHAGDIDGWLTLQAPTWENPHVDPAEVKAARLSLTAETFAEQFAGEFVTPHGRVYAEFDHTRHVGDFTPGPGALIVKGIDFGYTNPFACLWGCVDEHGVLHILREYYRGKAAMTTHTQAIRAVDDRFRALGCRIGPAYVDPSGAEQRALLQQEGIQATPARNHVEGGIEVVRQRLVVNEGRAGLQIAPGCMNLLREIDGYIWDEARLPHKQDDHALDALRYLCVSLSRHVDWNVSGFLW